MEREAQETTRKRHASAPRFLEAWEGPNSISNFQKQGNDDSELQFVENNFTQMSLDGTASEKERKSSTSILDYTGSQYSEKELGNSEDIIRAGYLDKKTDSFIKRWTNCYCLLTRKKLLCFSDDTRTRLISCLNFKKVDCRVKTKDDSGMSFDLVYGEEEIGHTFKTESIEKTELWIQDIHYIIKSFINEPKLKIRKGSQQLYHHEDTLLEDEFFKTAESGDILLMKTSDSKCALQRMITNSQYDHIGMVIKFPNGAIKVFEANADEGVQLYNWDDFHIKFSNYEKVCYRKLYSINKEELHPILVAFMKKMIGKNYSFGALKLLRRNSSEEAVELQSDFFCSELMAKAYKYIGILDNSKGSNSFWPVDFTDRGSIPFKGANYLGFEKLIILKRHIKLFQ